MTEINIIGDTTVNGDGTQITTTGDITINGDDAVVNVTEALEIPEYKAADLPVDGSVKLAWLIPDDGQANIEYGLHDPVSNTWSTSLISVMTRVLVQYSPTISSTVIIGNLPVGATVQVIAGWIACGLVPFDYGGSAIHFVPTGVVIFTDNTRVRTTLLPIQIAP